MEIIIYNIDYQFKERMSGIKELHGSYVENTE